MCDLTYMLIGIRYGGQFDLFIEALGVIRKLAVPSNFVLSDILIMCLEKPACIWEEISGDS